LDASFAAGIAPQSGPKRSQALSLAFFQTILLAVYPEAEVFSGITVEIDFLMDDYAIGNG
jgi:hypothetical protein